ncbi:MAG: folate family ECF transporter S component [Clostridiales bacterium]|nr:folate family ECF transporter S component [Clostridiales bacterium]
MSQNSAPVLFKTPFSRSYWAQAASEFKKNRVLIFAALMIALRVVLKMVSIPIGVDMRINTAFFINAYGAAVFGPVVAIVAAGISDILGCIVFPTGAYFFPFMFVEMAGSLFYALCFYRTKISAGRIILATFLINFGVNIVINTPIMMLYYDMIMGKYYAPFDMMRIVKNLVEMPVESFLLIIFFRAVIPGTRHLGFVTGDVDKLRFTRRNVALLIVLFVLGVVAVFGYSVHSYNTSSLSADYSAAQRIERNTAMQAFVREHNPELADETIVTIVESAYPKFRDPNVTYSVAVYTLDQAELEANIAEKLAEDPASTYGMDTLNGYSKSKAKADDALTNVGYATIVLDKKTDALVSYSFE